MNFKSTQYQLQFSYSPLGKTLQKLLLIISFKSCTFLLQITIFSPQVVNLIRDLDTDFSILGKNYVNVIQVSAHLLAMSSACYNPFIYASLHNKFLSCLCLHFLSQRRGKGKYRGQGSSSMTMSHKMARLYTSTIVADLQGVAMQDRIPQENYS